MLQNMNQSLISVLKKEIRSKYGKTGVELTETYNKVIVGSNVGFKAIQVYCSDAGISFMCLMIC